MNTEEKLPLKLFIFGSCASRDILNFKTNDDNVQLVNYVARSSLASIGTAPFVQVVPREKITSEFQRRMVSYDLDKKIFQLLRAKPFDVFLLDLIDERFRVFKDADNGTVCTMSSEFMRSGINLHSLRGRSTPPGTAMHWALWLKGWSRLLQALQGLGLLERLRINRVFWSIQTDSSDSFPAPFEREKIVNANQLLMQMYQKIAEDVGEQAFYNYPADVFVGSTNHRWGLSPFHYVDAYYQQAIEKLNNEPRRT